MSPPGTFVREDLYIAKRWRRVQNLANLFLTRWRHEYLATINKRQKWNIQPRNLQVDDIVLNSDDNAPRSSWRLARVIKLYPSDDGLVRSVKLQLSTSRLDRHGKRMCHLTYFDRPVHKLVLLLEA